jgi:uncharacterized coiled-coil DUF342 family protein
MNRAAILVGIFAITLLTMWGWSNSSSRAALMDRVKSLEDKTTRLDTELRGVIVIRDQAKQQLAKAETHIQKLQQVVKERDELRVQLQLRTTERDQVLAQYDEFRKSIKDAVGQADSTVLRFPDGQPVTVSITVPEYQK